MPARPQHTRTARGGEIEAVHVAVCVALGEPPLRAQAAHELG